MTKTFVITWTTERGTAGALAVEDRSKAIAYARLLRRTGERNVELYADGHPVPFDDETNHKKPRRLGAAAR